MNYEKPLQGKKEFPAADPAGNSFFKFGHFSFKAALQGLSCTRCSPSHIPAQIPKCQLVAGGEGEDLEQMAELLLTVSLRQAV
jgi:hypothetical protein